MMGSKDNVDRLYVSRKEGGRGFATIQDGINASIKDFINKREGNLITATENNTGSTSINRTKLTRKI